MAGRERFDPYRVLGVRRDASPAEVARAYRALAKRNHPDLHGPDAARRMRELNRSRHILSDPARRRAWDAGHPSPIPIGSHWTRPARETPMSRPADPAEWAAWEAARPSTVHGADRVRPAESWPRRSDAPAAPARVRDSGWLAATVAVAILVTLIVLGWVASNRPGAATPGDALALAGIDPVVRVELDATHELAAYRTDSGSMGIATTRRREGGWNVQVLEERPERTPLSVHLVSDAGGSAWRGIVYGSAPPEAAWVRLSVASTGGAVVDGLWAIGVRSPLRPEQVQWRFEAADGTVLLSGSGELQ
jgi:hypothetical protein